VGRSVTTDLGLEGAMTKTDLPAGLNPEKVEND